MFISDADFTDGFWQYALIKQDAIDDGLVFIATHSNIQCSSVPKGNALENRVYAQGQGGHPKFAERVAKLKDPNYRPRLGGIASVPDSCVIMQQ